jgi:hypothetical protein
MLFEQILDGGMGNASDMGWGSRAYRVIHGLQNEGVQVDKVSGDLERNNLPAAIGHVLESASEAAHDNGAFVLNAALRRDQFSPGIFAQFDGQVLEGNRFFG